MNKKIKFLLSCGIYIILTAVTFVSFTLVWNNLSADHAASPFVLSADLLAMILSNGFFAGVLYNKRINGRIEAILSLLILIYLTSFTDLIGRLYQGNAAYCNHVQYCHILSCTLSNACSLAVYIFARTIVKARKKYGIPLALLWLGINALIYVNNPWGLLFTIDANANLHQDGLGYFLCVMYPAITQCCALYLAYKYGVPERQKGIFTIFNIVPLVISASFYVAYDVNVLNIGYLATALICYISFFVEVDRENATLNDSLRRYFSDDIVGKLSDEQSEEFFVPRYHYASLLTIDVRGFTALSQHMTPDHLVSMVNHGFAAMVDIIENNNGVVLEFLGDGLTAVFGAPFPLAAHEEKAVCAAILIQNEMKKINQWNAERGYPQLGIGVGINTGNILLGSFGSKVKTAYKAVGRQADYSNYIQSLSANGEVLISENTLTGILCDVSASLSEQSDTRERDDKIYSVEALGNPYNVVLEKNNEELIALNKPYPLEFRIIEGKKIHNTVEKGFITALNETVVHISSKEDLSNVREIVFSIEGFDHMYAKRGKPVSKDKYEFIYASKPNDFLRWIIRILTYSNFTTIDR